MFYIAPAWNDEIKELTMDPIRSLTNVLNGGDKDVTLVILNFLPNFRNILLANDLTHINYLNVWDAILGIRREDGLPLTLDEIDLPDDADVYNTPYDVASVYRQDEFYASVYGGRTEGHIRKVEFIENGKIWHEIYDDRGFKACTNYYDDQGITMSQWFNEDNECVIEYRRDADMQIEVKDHFERFNRRQYKNKFELFDEFIDKMLVQKMDRQNDTFIASTNEQLRPMMLTLQNKIPTNYIIDNQQEINAKDLDNLKPQILGSNKCFVYNYYIFDKLQELLDEEALSHLELGYPYGTSMHLGSSNEERKLIIYWNIGKYTSAEDFEKTSKELVEYLKQDTSVNLIMATENQEQINVMVNNGVSILRERYEFIEDEDFAKISNIITGKNISKNLEELVGNIQIRLGVFLPKEKQNPLLKETNWDDFVDDVLAITTRKSTKSYEIRADLNRARILIDLGKPYDMVMQFNAISAGIPQINQVASPFVNDQKNGWVVKKGHSLIDGLDYYFKELRHWNVSLVETVQYMEKLSVKHQADWWERRLNG